MRPLIYPAVVAALYGWAVFASTFDHPGAIGLDYTAPGTDFMVFYGAIRLALTHHFALSVDWVQFTAYLNTSFAHILPKPLMYRPWVYPPSFLVLLLPFGFLGFWAAFAAFQLCSAAVLAAGLLYGAASKASGRWLAAAAVLCPAAAVNACFGQCGVLVAGLLVLGSRLLPARPVLAGLVFGLISVKPQFGLMVPVLLIALRQWRAIAGAAASSAGLIATSILVFGVSPWRWWIEWMHDANTNAGSAWAINGRLWGTDVYACAALLHATAFLCTALQLAALAAGAASVYWAGRRLPPDRALAILLAATVLGSPHVGTYDLVVLFAAGGVWFATVQAPTVKHGLVLLLLWLLPFLEPPAINAAGRLEPLLIIGFIGLVLSAALRPRMGPLKSAARA